MTNRPRVARLQTRLTGETRDGLPVHELVGTPNGKALEELLGKPGGPDVVEVDVNPQIQALLGEQTVQILQLRAAATQLYERATKAEAARDQLQQRLDLLTVDGH